jgi:hypothetical protein
MQIPINELINTWLPPLGWSTIITGIVSATWYCFTAKAQWNGLVAEQREQGEQLKLAMTNHLPHIEAATERTAAAVEHIAEAIQQQAVSLARIQTILETQNRYEH